MARPLRGWLALSGRERVQFLGLAVSLAIVHASLAVVGYVRTRLWVERLSAGRAQRAATAEDLEAARRLAWLTEVAGRRGPVQATCLRQALVLHGWLRRRGLNPEIVIGVRRDVDTPLVAHAWVELEGASIDVGGVSADASSAPARPRHVPLRKASARTSGNQ